MASSSEANDLGEILSTPPTSSDGDVVGWQLQLGRELVVALKDGDTDTIILKNDYDYDYQCDSDGDGDGDCHVATGDSMGYGVVDRLRARSMPCASGWPEVVMIRKVYSRLSKNNPYVGFFHYAPRWVMSHRSGITIIILHCTDN